MVGRTPSSAAARTRLCFWLPVIGLLCNACSVLLDASDKQCSVDADCVARGLSGSTCVNNLCQPTTAAAGNGVTASGVESMAGTMSLVSGSQAPSEPPDAGRMPMAGEGSATVGMSPAGSNAQSGSQASMPAPSPTTAGDSATAGVAGSVASQSSAGAMAPCMGADCPECSTSEDCERDGQAGAMCVESKCWMPPPECSADKDCEARGPEYVGGRCMAAQCRPNPRWRCEPVDTTEATGTTMLTVPLVDALTLGPIANVHVVACNKLDLMCAQPVADSTTGSDGKLKITVPASFAGYLQQTERRDYAPAMYFLPATLPADGMLPNFPLLASGVIIDALALALGAGLDPARGHMMLIADDCAGDTVAGITFASPQADPMTVQFYVRDQLPSTTAKDTADAGNGGYLNFPAGTTLITAKDDKSGLELATVSVLVRPGFITVSYIRPMSR